MRVVVTGSGTDSGKTWVTARWVEALRAAGQAVTALKPVLSGMDAVPLEETDAGRLVAAMGQPVTPAAVPSARSLSISASCAGSCRQLRHLSMSRDRSEA